MNKKIITLTLASVYTSAMPTENQHNVITGE